MASHLLESVVNATIQAHEHVEKSFVGTNSHPDVVSISLFGAVLCLCIIVGHLIGPWINESVSSLVIGLIFGTLILLWSVGKNSHILRFNEELFFIYLLPPIIFNAGFQVKKKHFFRNFSTVMLFGVFGVFISSAIISTGSWWILPKIGFTGLTAKEYLAIGTIFSSTDTVCTLQVLNQDETPLLYSLVFGEGVVNDATSVVLLKAIQKLDISNLDGWTALHVFVDFLYLFITSTALGIAAGLVTAYALKRLYLARHSTDREIALMALVAYLSYMLAELLNLSGILTVFLSGIVMSHYAWHNITESSRITTKHAFATMSFIAERFIFLYVGMDALDMEKWKTSHSAYSISTCIGIYGCITFLLLLGRAAFVFPLSALSNYMDKNSERVPINFNHQVIIWWAGVMRGAVSIALAFSEFTYSGVTDNPVHATMVTNTIIVVLFTTLVFGSLTVPLVNLLVPHRALDNHPEQSISREELHLPLMSFQESATTNIIRAKNSLSMFLHRPVSTIHYYWRKIDDAYMRPVFGGPSRGNVVQTVE